MKITKRQLRRIIKEEKRKLLKEQASGWDNFTPEGEAEDEMYLAAEDLPELLKAVEYNREEATMADEADMRNMYEDDASQLQDIHDMAKDAFDAMEVVAPQILKDYIPRLDTAVREQIPQNLYGWITGNW